MVQRVLVKFVAKTDLLATTISVFEKKAAVAQVALPVLDTLKFLPGEPGDTRVFKVCVNRRAWTKGRANLKGLVLGCIEAKFCK